MTIVKQDYFDLYLIKKTIKKLETEVCSSDVIVIVNSPWEDETPVIN